MKSRSLTLVVVESNIALVAVLPDIELFLNSVVPTVIRPEPVNDVANISWLVVPVEANVIPFVKPASVQSYNPRVSILALDAVKNAPTPAGVTSEQPFEPVPSPVRVPRIKLVVPPAFPVIV